jgi:hypothetical protein
LELFAPWVNGSELAPNPVTRAYTDLFASTSLPLLEGMTLLWATEFSYLKAWQNVVSKNPRDNFSHDLDGDALRSLQIGHLLNINLLKGSLIKEEVGAVVEILSL